MLKYRPNPWNAIVVFAGEEATREGRPGCGGNVVGVAVDGSVFNLEARPAKHVVLRLLEHGGLKPQCLCQPISFGDLLS